MEENLLLAGKSLPKKTMTAWRRLYVYALLGFFCAAAMAYEGLAPLVIAFGAALLFWPKEEMTAGIIGCLAAVLIWRSNTLVISAGLAAIGLFGLCNYYSRRKWQIWQQSLLLGIFAWVCGALGRVLLDAGNILSLSLANGVLTAAAFFLLRQSLADGEKFLQAGEIPPRERLLYPILTLMAMLMGLSGIELMGLMPQRILLSLSILLCLYYGQTAAGIGAALLLGLVSVLSGGQSPVLIGYAGICALAAGLGENYGKMGLGAAYSIACVLLGWLMTDWSGLIRLLGETLLAWVLLLGWPELPPKTVKTHARGWLRADSSYAKISQAVGILGQAMDKPLPEEQENALTAGCSKIYALLCQNCRSRDYCWQDRLAETTKAIGTAYRHGWQHGVQGSLLDEDFALSCRHAEAVNEAVIAQIMLGRQQENYRRSLIEYRNICANELALVSKALRSLTFEPPKSQREQYLWQYLTDHGLPVQYVQIEIKNGNMPLSIALKECVADCERLTADLLTQVYHRQYVLQKKECSWQDKYCRMFFVPQERVFLAVNAWQRRAAGEKVCGDLWRHFKLDESRECILLIDGMGIGEQAYRQSLQAAETLEQMLKGDFAPEDALALVNNHLLLQNAADSFITLELLTIDILSLKAELYKAAGNVSYLVRNGLVQKIEAASLPLGILSGFQSAKQTFNLQIGDRFLLLTDGLAESKLKWAEILPTLSPNGDEALKQLFNEVSANHDDQSAVLIDIWSIKQDG